MKTKVVTDLDTLRAVAHPLRMRLLGALRTHGPATASQLGRALGESSGATSYHLRQLARFGFIVDDDPHEGGGAGEDAPRTSGRERRWRAAHDVTELPPELWASDAGREAHAQLTAGQTEHLRRGLAARASATDPSDPTYDHSDYLLHLDPEDVQALLADLRAVVTRYSDRTGARPVSLHLLALPATT